MKAIYKALALITLFLIVMGNVVSIATSREEATMRDLTKKPADWRIEVLKDNISFTKKDEDELKTNVLGFFEQAGLPTQSALVHYTIYLVIIFVLSTVGYYRERWLYRNLQRTTEGTDELSA